MFTRKTVSRVLGLVVALSLVIASVAGAYSVPKPPGSAGGPPTKPTSTTTGTGTSTPAATKAATAATSAAATSLGTKLAALTDTELVIQDTFTITVTFPSGGTILASVSASVGTIGQGHAGRATKGTEPLSLSLSAKGRAFLLSHAGTAEKLTITLTFVPNKGGKRTTSTVTLMTPD